MKIQNLLVIGLGLVSSSLTFAQETEKVDTLSQLEQRTTLLEDALASSKKLKISGYIQSEYQSSQIDINGNATQDMKVGAGANAGEKAAVQTPGSTFDRFGVRRGRLKATYTDKGCTGVVYIDATEKGVVLKEAYATATDQWAGIATLKGGIFYRPFGYEIEYSSSSRYSPERSRIIQTLFPSERDLGATITLQGPKNSFLNAFKLEAGLLAGNAIGLDTKSQKDLIGHLTFNQAGENLKYGLGVSYYNGVIFQPTKKVYSMNGNVFSVDSATTNLNGYAKRQYIGFDGQFVIKSFLGVTNIRAEYIYGTQPSSSSSSSSPDLSVKPTNYGASVTAPVNSDANAIKLNGAAPGVALVGLQDTYIRNFAGGYINLEHDILDTKFSIVAKYDWYDPNSNIAGNLIGATGSKTGKADIAYSTIGLGVIYRMTQNVKLTAYYDMVTNETSSAMSAAGTNYTKVLAANLLTVRLQYKF
jgi:hypothetical protein